MRNFQRGQSTFDCGVCKRLTRNTGDNGGVDLCPQCYELAGMENSISDGYVTLESQRPKARKLIDAIRAKGGAVTDWLKTFGLK